MQRETRERDAMRRNDDYREERKTTKAITNELHSDFGGEKEAKKHGNVNKHK